MTLKSKLISLFLLGILTVTSQLNASGKKAEDDEIYRRQMAAAKKLDDINSTNLFNPSPKQTAGAFQNYAKSQKEAFDFLDNIGKKKKK
jgi:hypothetical protein